MTDEKIIDRNLKKALKLFPKINKGKTRLKVRKWLKKNKSFVSSLHFAGCNPYIYAFVLTGGKK